MKKELIERLHQRFERHACDVDGVEYWFARDLQELLGYTKWTNFVTVIDKAKIACKQAGQEIEDHFTDVGKMVDLGSGSQREIKDIALTRYACYLIAQNGDPRKDRIAFAMTYFAVQTRKQELIEERLIELERLSARKKLTTSEKELSGIIFERLDDQASFARIRSKGDMALFGRHTTRQMKDRLGVPDKRPLADFLPTILIKAKDFATEITNFKLKKDRSIDTEGDITAEHVKHHEDVRGVLTDRGIVPEELPPAENIKKVERRMESEARQLPKAVKRKDKS